MPWLSRPELTYTLEAMRVTEEMRKQGVVLTLDQAHALAQANLGPPKYWVAKMPELSEEDQQLLDHTTRKYATDQHELDHTRRQPHDHGRLREEQVDLVQDHDRLQLMGIDQTAPETHTNPIAEADEVPAPSGVDHGQDGTAGRAQQRNADRKKKKTPLEQFLAEDRDRIDFEDEE
jgi:hypothetical protein